MKFLKALGIILLFALAATLIIVVLYPGFILLNNLLGMEPVVICAALLILGFALAVIIKNPYLEKVIGLLIGALILSVILYYALTALTGAVVPVWIILLIVAAIGLAVFLTSVLKNIPFIGEKLIPPIWIFTVFAVIMIILTNTVAK